MKKVIFATGNEGKMKEIREILGDLDIELLSLKDAGIHADIVEDGKTFEENAQIKAKAIRDLTGEIVLADDSGDRLSQQRAGNLFCAIYGRGYLLSYQERQTDRTPRRSPG